MEPVVAMDVVVLSAIIAIPTAIVVALITLFVWFKVEPAHIGKFFVGIKSRMLANRNEHVEFRTELDLLRLSQTDMQNLIGKLLTNFDQVMKWQVDQDTAIKELQQEIKDLQAGVNTVQGTVNTLALVVPARRVIRNIEQRVDLLTHCTALLAKATGHSLNEAYFLTGEGRWLKQQVRQMAEEIESDKEIKEWFRKDLKLRRKMDLIISPPDSPPPPQSNGQSEG